MTTPSVAIIGTGWGARVQLPAFRDGGFTIAGIAGARPDKTRALAAETGVRPFDDWQSLIHDSNANLISIVAPPAEHRAMAIAALEAGKHVLCEKPTALNAAEAEEMMRAAESRPEQIAIIDHELRFLPSWVASRSSIGDLGPLRAIDIRYSSPGRGDRSKPWSWWSDAEQGGGIWGAVGSHLVDAIRYFAGEIAEASAHLHTVITTRPLLDSTRPVTSDDHSSITLRLTSGILATITLSVVATNDEPTVITIHGEDGGLRLTNGDALRAKRGEPWSPSHTHAGNRVTGDSDGGYFGSGTVALVAALSKAIAGDRSALAPAATFRDGLQQQRILDAARASSAAGGIWTAVPFVGEVWPHLPRP